MSDKENEMTREMALSLHRDHNGERGLTPTGVGWFPWQTTQAMREYLDALKVEMERLKTSCSACGHEWRRHDPVDGRCDAHSAEPGVFGPCRCGRDVAFTAASNARLSTEALGDGVPISGSEAA
jgi:hypothetical protein